MIEIDVQNKTYTCPFCDRQQSFNGQERFVGYNNRVDASAFYIYQIKCNNKGCEKISVIAINCRTYEQIDLIPTFTYKNFPDYVPEQIRNDYKEGVAIIQYSPKAAACMFRRCLQGMIRDFWGISKNRLIDEINELNSKVSVMQWKAIDAVRQIGNIGAHMEKDVDMIVDVDENEAIQLQYLIELLINNWYISRYNEEQLCNSISNIAIEKKNLKNS